MNKLISNLKYKFREMQFPYKPYMNKHKCIFIHIPKTAGSSIITALSGGVSRRQHLPWYIFQKANPEKYEKYYKFAFVRHPIERAISAYNYLSRGGNEKNDLIIKKKLDNYKDFNDFVINGLSDGYFRNHPMFLPQSDFIVRFDQELAVDFLGKFEEIDESFGEIARKLNLDIKLPKINMSNKSDDINIEEEALSILNLIYAQDFVNFEY